MVPTAPANTAIVETIAPPAANLIHAAATSTTANIGIVLILFFN